MITKRRVKEFWKKKKKKNKIKLGKTEEINILIEKYESMESKLIDNGGGTIEIMI